LSNLNHKTLTAEEIFCEKKTETKKYFTFYVPW